MKGWVGQRPMFYRWTTQPTWSCDICSHACESRTGLFAHRNWHDHSLHTCVCVHVCACYWLNHCCRLSVMTSTTCYYCPMWNTAASAVTFGHFLGKLIQCSSGLRPGSEKLRSVELLRRIFMDDQMPFLSPNQQYPSTVGSSVTISRDSRMI